MCPAKTPISQGICPVWSVFAVRKKKPWVLSYPLSTQPRLIRLGRCPGWSESLLGGQVILLVLLCWDSDRRSTPQSYTFQSENVKNCTIQTLQDRNIKLDKLGVQCGRTLVHGGHVIMVAMETIIIRMYVSHFQNYFCLDISWCLWLSGFHHKSNYK